LILDPEQVDRWVAEQRRSGHTSKKTIGFTCGTFDICHAGHVQYLQAAKALCDSLIVAVNTDESVRSYKNPLRPINPERERMYVISALGCVDVVTPMTELRPLSLLLRWKPDFYIKGGDYSSGSLRSGKAVEEYGGSVKVIPPEFSVSTTTIMERITALAQYAPPEQPTKIFHEGLVFLDRDGTLIQNIPFLGDPDQVKLLPGVVEGLARLHQAGYRLVIATNQQGIGLGYFSLRDMIAVNQRMFREIAGGGAAISRVYYCPHSMAEECVCRKPSPGMIQRALADFQAKPEQSFVIGDLEADAEAARQAGCTPLIVGPRFSFTQAVDRILSLPATSAP